QALICTNRPDRLNPAGAFALGSGRSRNSAARAGPYPNTTYKKASGTRSWAASARPGPLDPEA
ncbi:hypothetical protein, partial [Paralcaligenes ginsengisoli]